MNEQQRREFVLLLQAAVLLVEIDGKFTHGVPDCIDNDGERYQSEYAWDLIRRVKIAVKRLEPSTTNKEPASPRHPIPRHQIDNPPAAALEAGQ